jgi:hypothetical protein
MGLDMVGTSAAGGSLPVLTNWRRLDIEGDCRARSTLLGGGEQSFFAPIGVVLEGVDTELSAMTSSKIVTLP